MTIANIAKPDIFEGTEDEWQAYVGRCMDMTGYIILIVPQSAEYYEGTVERSFDLARSLSETQFFWDGNYFTNLGTKGVSSGWDNAQFRIDVLRKTDPHINAIIFNARDDDLLPVKLNWEQWILDGIPTGKYGFAMNKYGFRNIGFTVDTSKPMIQ